MLGLGQVMAIPGPSGMFEPGRGRWIFEAHLVQGTRFPGWRS